MKKAKFTKLLQRGLFLLSVSLSVSLAGGQTVTQIGMGTDVPANTLYAPVYRYSATSTTTGCRSNILYTAAEMSTAGIPAGSTISAIAFKKVNAASFTSSASFNVYMANTATVPPLTTTTTWASIQSTYTPVYQNATFNVPNGAGWVTWNITPFVYTGGSLEIAFELVMAGNGGASDNFQWEFTSGFSDYIIGVANTTGATLNGTVAAYKQRPNIQISYQPSTPCAGIPTPGTIAANFNMVCPSEQLIIAPTGGTAAGNLQYQWQTSVNGITWSDIPGATFSVYASNQNNAAANYRLRVICPAGPDTAYSNVEFVDIEPFFNCYCTSNATNTNYTDIDHITLSNLTTTPSPTCATFTDYTATPINLLKGVPYNFSALITNCSSSTVYTSTTKVYIDYNQNGSYSDPGEEVFLQTTTSGNTIGGVITVPPSAMNGQTGMRIVANQTSTVGNVNPCGTYTYGETEDYIVDISPQPADEVALVSIDSPVRSQCATGNEILVTLRNNGTDTIHSLTFDLNQGGVANNGIGWTGVIAPGQDLQVSVPGTYVFNDGDTLGVTVRDPNGNADLTLDNSRGLRHYISLGGEYTVGYGITDLALHQFATIDTAVYFVYQKGVCDTVYLNIKDGSYQARYLLLGDYFDYDPGEMVIFRSESKNAANLVLHENALAAASNYLVKLDATRGWGFQHITFEPEGTSYRNAITVTGGSSNIFIDSCRFIGSTNNTGLTTASDNTTAITLPSGGPENDVTISHNFFQDFGGAVRVYGASSGYESGNRIIGNHMSRIHATAIHSYYQNGLEIRDNLIVMDTVPGGGATTQYGLYGYYQNGGVISGNTFISNEQNYAIYISSAGGTALQPYLISNNFFYSGATTQNASAIRSISTNNNSVDIVNNSISYNTNATTYALIDISSGSNFRLINNIVAGSGNAPLISVGSNIAMLYSDHNNWYKANGTDMGDYLGQVMPTLSDWFAATGFDPNSQEVDPAFNNEDLHTCVVELDEAGEPYPGLTVDIDGDARGAVPDIGADEFLASNLGLLNDDLLDKCQGESVTIGSDPVNSISYSWSPGGATTSSISVTQADTYVLTASSSCGSYTDTVVVNDLPAAGAAFSLSGSYGLAALPENNSTGALGYLWDFGDGNTSTAEEPYHLYGAEGTYTITLTVYGACDTNTVTEVFNAVALATEEWADGTLELFPNPATDILQLRYSQMPAAQVQADVMDMSGKVVMAQTFAMGQNGIYILDVNTLKTGVYQLRLRMDNMQKVIRFIKK